MSLEKEITLTIKIKADTPYRLKDKVTALETISRLDAEDMDRIVQICENKKALKALKEKWNMLKIMF